jgi:hypothetical protein
LSLDKNTQQTHLMNPTSTPPPRPALNFTPSPKEKAGNKVGEGKQNKEVFGKPKKHQISKKHVGSKYKPATRREGEKRRKRQRHSDTVTREKQKKRQRRSKESEWNLKHKESARHRRRCCWPDTSAVVVVPDQNTCAGKKKKEKT